MPKPGPRPFECVRRAWHSDGHQPIRGSLIQEILRVVNEIHSSATRSNREWQEKLPIVVLKAEEIIYSKANSEAEYTDLTTVRDRTSDAINTIIRLDESTETGDLLQPCIEAALVLGSVPRTPSRSQRNHNPRCYLTPTTSKPESVYVPCTSGFLKKVSQNNHITNPPPSNGSNSKLQKHHHRSTSTLPSWSQNVPRCASNSCSSMYPGSPLQSQLNSSPTPRENPELAKTDHLQNLSLRDADAPKENHPGVECDLSLRLGPLSSIIKSGFRKEKGRPSDLTQPMDKELSFFPIREDSDYLVSSCSMKWSHDAEMVSIKKPKLPYSSVPAEDRYSYWQPKLPCNQNNHGKSPNAAGL